MDTNISVGRRVTSIQQVSPGSAIGVVGQWEGCCDRLELVLTRRVATRPIIEELVRAQPFLSVRSYTSRELVLDTMTITLYQPEETVPRITPRSTMRYVYDASFTGAMSQEYLWSIFQHYSGADVTVACGPWDAVKTQRLLDDMVAAATPGYFLPAPPLTLETITQVRCVFEPVIVASPVSMNTFRVIIQ